MKYFSIATDIICLIASITAFIQIDVAFPRIVFAMFTWHWIKELFDDVSAQRRF